jgi:hypothetical protein
MPSFYGHSQAEVVGKHGSHAKGTGDLIAVLGSPVLRLAALFSPSATRTDHSTMPPPKLRVSINRPCVCRYSTATKSAKGRTHEDPRAKGMAKELEDEFAIMRENYRECAALVYAYRFGLAAYRGMAEPPENPVVLVRCSSFMAGEGF